MPEWNQPYGKDATEFFKLGIGESGSRLQIGKINISWNRVVSIVTLPYERILNQFILR